MSALSTLIDAHKVAMAAYDACSDTDWHSFEKQLLGALDAARDALFDHRPETLDEVRAKAEYMASCRAFIDWDDFDRIKLIAALTPTTGSRP